MCLMLNVNSNLENKNFDSMKYNILDATDDILLDNWCDLDSNYFTIAITIFDTSYVKPKEFHTQFKDHISCGLSFLHINVRSINKKFENFKLFLSSLGLTFSAICFSETCLDETTSSNKSLYELPKWTSIPQVRKHRRREESHCISTNLYNKKYKMIWA